MKKHPALLFQYALVGIGYGIPVTIICMALLGGWKAPLGEFTVWTVASALIGLLSGLVYGSEQLTLPWALAIHGTGILAIVTVACRICGYGSSLLRIAQEVFPVFVIVYALIYAINYYLIKLEEKRVNAALDTEN